MMKKMTTLCILIATILGIITFSAKQKVMILEDRLVAMNQKIRVLKESRHILQAEWSYLNEPSRLQRLAQRHLPIQSGKADLQLTSLENVVGPMTAPYDGDAMLRLASALEGATGEKAVR